MTKVLLVDHAFHRVTESSQFFADLLATSFAVTRLYVVPDARLDIDWELIGAHDIIVLWQVDYLAPLFLTRGYRTVVVPMYDASSALPQVHWIAAGGARFVNFSRILHERIRLLGLDTMLAKYFPEPVAEHQLPEFGKLRALLWQRRPEDGIHTDLLRRLFADQLDSVHVHNVPDNPSTARHFPIPATIGRADVTVSKWFSDRLDYQKLLETCNIFICPRPAEGIGVAMLEAMARGMLVVGNDLPTHNEYVSNWVNGVLFNTSNVGPANFEAAGRIARMGWHTVCDGRRRWLAATDRLLDFIAGVPRYRPAPAPLVAHLGRDLMPAYLAGSEAYERLLLRLLPALTARTPAAPDDRDAPARTVRQEARWTPVTVLPTRAGGKTSVRLNFANGAARMLLRRGWSWDEDFGVWIEGARATLCFAATIDDPVAGLALRLRVVAPANPDGRSNLMVAVNDVLSRESVAVPCGIVTDTCCVVVPNAPITTDIWTVEIICDQVCGIPGDQRQLSLAILALDVDFLPLTIAASPVAAEEPRDQPMAIDTHPSRETPRARPKAATRVKSNGHAGGRKALVKRETLVDA